GIAFYTWDMSDDFEREVVDDFVSEYAAGRTPNPCMRCNEAIKFSALLDRAVALGFDAVCTGHYAQIVTAADGTRELHRGVDVGKDQSYVLAVLTQDQLARAMFPLGDSIKPDIRREAAARGLLVADKPDSVDICFIPDGNTARWLRDRIGDEPGPIVDAETGTTIGSHEGAFGFTIGQRKGLGIRTATPDGAPRYVVAIDTETRTVSVGAPTLLVVDTVTASRWRSTGAPMSVGQRCFAQVRAHGDVTAARVSQTSPDALTVVVDQDMRGVAAGQTLALYDGTRVLGSGTITAATRTRR
ncbi:MAG: tRNA 2-thiouridine(34) synthase MnmA, partial [Actinomycetes bacterium]